MKILVIEDSLGNIASAKETLKGHELTIVSDSWEARQLLVGDKGEVRFDALLTDLYMPVDRFPDARLGQSELPVGLAFALNAVNRGMRVVICTDTDRHEDLLTWILGLVSSFCGLEDKQLVSFVQMNTCPIKGYWDEQSSQIVMCEDWYKHKGRFVKDWMGAVKNSRLFPELFPQD